VPIAGKAVLEHVLDNITATGITEIGIVVGDQAATIEEAIGDGDRFGARITYIHQAEPLGLAHCVIIARDFLGDDDFLMYLGDNMLPEGIGEVTASFAAERPAAHIVVQKVPDPGAYGVAEIDEHGSVRALAEKPAEPASDLALIGVYCFTPAVHEAVSAIGPSPRGELEITDAIAWLVDKGEPVTAREYAGYWQDTGNVDAVLQCNRRLLDVLRPESSGHADAESRVSGPVLLEAGARVVRSTIQGPAVIGTGSVVEDSHIGPYTSIGRRCHVQGAGIEDSIVLDGSTVSGLRGLSTSLIGRSASVRSTTRHRLIVGDDCEVEVAT
jgi:glucose-1-phosphate thymidylyltransferase